MEQGAQERDDLRLYLLGLLPQERQPLLEEYLLTDTELYEELLISEDELIDQYLAGRLTERDRQAFESHFLSTPERNRQVRFASAFRAYIADKGGSPDRTRNELSEESDEKAEHDKGTWNLLSWLPLHRPALAFSLIAAALVFIGGISWMVISSLRTDVSPQELAFLLTPGGQTRSGGDVQTVLIPLGTGAVQLQLRLAAVDFQNYHATLLTGEGIQVLTAEGLQPMQSDNGLVLIVTVPAERVTSGEYQLKLNGINAEGKSETVDSYRFRIVDR